MEKKFLHGNLFGQHTFGITVPLHAFCLALQLHDFHFRLQDGFVAHYPDDFVYDVVRPVCRSRYGLQRVGQCTRTAGTGGTGMQPHCREDCSCKQDNCFSFIYLHRCSVLSFS